jgi:Fe-S oxidoreductase
VKKVSPQILSTANPGCMLQLRAGVRKWELEGVRVAHVIEVLDEAYRTGGKKA